MTEDDIMLMAQKAGPLTQGPFDAWCKRFAALVAAHKAEVITAEAYRCGVGAGADELRRLHEVNQELLEALKDATEGLEIASAGGGVDFYAYAKTSCAAIAKAEGEMK